jgi:hypothetical protein
LPGRRGRIPPGGQLGRFGDRLFQEVAHTPVGCEQGFYPTAQLHVWTTGGVQERSAFPGGLLQGGKKIASAGDSSVMTALLDMRDYSPAMR